VPYFGHYMPSVLAAADIGSNTAHLLVARIDGCGLTRLVNQSDWLSLGEVVGREGGIPEPLVLRLVETLTRFKDVATASGAERWYAFATEAVRRAANRDEVLSRVASSTGLQVDLVTPCEESLLGLRGAMMDSNGEAPFTLIEAGGGSVQVARCDGFEILEEVSMPLGTGALTAKFELTSPPIDAALEDMKEAVHSAVRRLRSFGASQRVVGTGGVARGIWRALHPDGDRMIHAKELDFLGWDVARLGVDRIVKRYGVKLRRAATLLPGSIVYSEILATLGHEALQVSEFGVREGAVLHMSQGRIPGVVL